MFIKYFETIYMFFKRFRLKTQNLVVDITLPSVHDIFNILNPSVYFMCQLV